MAKVNPTAKSAPAAPASARPGVQEPAAKKPEKAKVVRVLHPALQPDGEGKATTKLKEIPADFNPKLHKPLTRKHFEDESIFLELKAREFDAKAANLRKQAEELKKIGTVKDRGAAKKLLSLQKRIDELTKDLAAKGVDVDAIKQALFSKQAAKEEPAPAQA